ncbi:tetratricopeptide repeat protein [Chitinispirillales bacterium ANBcel5]|uniref:tetratricopeptide repeat protein n=1 Tax=Cellulosispirillum alkaliphilum TaxID=3039283 RepID=UPI002A527FAC|nr:tetratricopeptide repeat protein [Chitinispirillales bacterium ANBcel5]
MNIKYNKKKQEMKKDPVLDWLFSAKEYAKKNSVLLIGALLVLLFIGAVSVFSSRAREADIRQSQDLFARAVLEFNDENLDDAIVLFGDAANNFGNTPQGKMSAFMLGSIYFEQQKYLQAIEWFQLAVTNMSSAGFVGAQALVGIATSHEALGNEAEAMQYYERALRDQRISFNHASIRWKMALLSAPSDTQRSQTLLQEIISDPEATDYHSKAQNFLASLTKAG